MKKAASTLCLAAIPVAATYFYYWFFKEHYFPHRYEEAFGAIAASAGVSVLVLVVLTAFHLVTYLRRRSAP